MARRRRARSSVRLGLPALALIGLLAYFFPRLAPVIWTITQQREQPNQAQTTALPTPPVTPAAETGRGNMRIASFGTAKRRAATIFAGQNEFYCGCRYEGTAVDLASCGYEAKRDTKRSRRIEWDHVLAAENFGRSFPEWEAGHPECVHRGEPFAGRGCVSKVSLAFRHMESDLYNLQPAIGELNVLRFNYRMSMIEGEPRAFGACDIEIDSQTRRVEPRPEIRGDIARTYFYMEWAYPAHAPMADASRKLFEVWAKQDPVDDWERERAKRIQEIQGNVNPFIK